MLIDELMLIQPKPKSRAAVLWRYLPEAQVYRIDDVARFVERTRITPGRTLDTTKEIPNVAPLAPVTWVEWNTIGLKWEKTHCRMGALVVYYEVPEDHEFYDSGKWYIEMIPFKYTVDDYITYPDFSLLALVAKDGTIVMLRHVPDDDVERSSISEKQSGMVTLETYFALTGICFAHCRGVRATEHRQPRQQRRARQRANQPPLFDYRTIDIGPAVGILRKEGHIERNGIAVALHLCRGHFRNYTDEAPLFGKYTGTVYIPMHLRGRDVTRTIIHDYRVRANDQDPMAHA
jgi:hypothetical protein